MHVIGERFKWLSDCLRHFVIRLLLNLLLSVECLRQNLDSEKMHASGYKGSMKALCVLTSDFSTILSAGVTEHCAGSNQ